MYALSQQSRKDRTSTEPDPNARAGTTDDADVENPMGDNVDSMETNEAEHFSGRGQNSPQPIQEPMMDNVEENHGDIQQEDEPPLQAFVARSNAEIRHEELLQNAVDAIEVRKDKDAGDQSNRNWKRIICSFSILCSLVVCCALAIVLRTIVFSNSSSEDEPSIVNGDLYSETPSLSPTLHSSTHPSLIPSLIPTAEPSVSPTLSLSPTTGRLSEVVALIKDKIIGSDPEYSDLIDALDDKTSPQFRAASWLAQEDTYFDDFALTSIGQLSEFSQRYAAVVLFYATGGEDSWIDDCNFLSPGHICEWNNPVVPGVSEQYSFGIPNGAATKLSGVAWCVDSEVFGRVALAVQIAGNNMTGALPAEIAAFVHLRYLLFPVNFLSGTIPSTLYDLVWLEQLLLPYNELIGSIDGNIGNLEALKLMWLSNNLLTGTIPSEVGRLSNLLSMHFSYNQMSGMIPEEIVNIETLEILILENNTFSGALPTDLGRLNRLDTLSLGDNYNLSWMLPGDIGDNFPKLRTLGLEGVKLEGSIPNSFGKLRNLETVSMGDTGLTGNISPIPSLSKLRAFAAPQNALTGSIPQSMGNLSDLFLFDLSFNQLTGNLPEELGFATNMNLFSVQSNRLTGNIPKTYSNWTFLQFFSIKNNFLTGNMDFLCNSDSQLTAEADCDGEITCNVCCLVCCNEIDECYLT